VRCDQDRDEVSTSSPVRSPLYFSQCTASFELLKKGASNPADRFKQFVAFRQHPFSLVAEGSLSSPRFPDAPRLARPRTEVRSRSFGGGTGLRPSAWWLAGELVRLKEIYPALCKSSCTSFGKSSTADTGRKILTRWMFHAGIQPEPVVPFAVLVNILGRQRRKFATGAL